MGLKQEVANIRAELGMVTTDEFDFMSDGSLRTWLRRYEKLKAAYQDDPTQFRGKSSEDIALLYCIDLVDAIAFCAFLDR